MRRRALLGVVGATALAGCGGRLGGDPTDSESPTESQTTDATPTATTDPAPRLELASSELVRSNEGSESELARVTGTVRNVSEKTVPEATVTATFEDADGEPLDSATANASDLSPGRTWSFELVYPGTGEDARAVADYSLAVETGD
ncbi:FxLYD domain-containing protein [Halorussus sp. AFM4]|uniref:FxLYD domain-containing protein n=1 Tax=Halorussus sp. AFM4 TaxID=3421651 RepID=UPI003EBD6EC3